MNQAKNKVRQARSAISYFFRNVMWIMILCFVFVSAVFLRANEPSFALNRQTSQTIDTDKKKPTKHRIVKVRTTHRDTQYVGAVLYATDSLLVIWNSMEPYDSLKLNALALSLPFYEIEQIIIVQKGHFWSGLGYGFMVGGGIGALSGLASGGDWLFTAGEIALIQGGFLGVCGASIGGLIGAVHGIDHEFIISGNAEKYRLIVPILQKNAIFCAAPPPGLPPVPQKAGVEILPPMVEPSDEEKTLSQRPSTARFHISIGAGFVLTKANNDIIQAFNSSGFSGREEDWLFGTAYDCPYDASAPISWNAGLDYSLTDHLRLGLVWSKFPKQDIQGIDQVFEYAHGTSYSLLVEYVPAPVTSFSLLTSRWKFAIGAGVSYNSLAINGTLSTSWLNSIFDGQDPVSFEINQNKIGIHARSSLDYYLKKSFSLQFKVEGRLTPSIEVPAISHTKPKNNYVKTLKQHDVDFSAVDISLGFRLHF